MQQNAFIVFYKALKRIDADIIRISQFYYGSIIIRMRYKNKCDRVYVFFW